MPRVVDLSAMAAPRLKEALAYWQSKLAGRSMPSRHDIDPVEIPRLLSHVMLVDVLSDPLDFRYRLIGTAVCEISQQDYTGKRYSEVPGKGPTSTVWTNCAEVVRAKVPLVAVPPYIGPDQRVLGCETILLPLSHDGREVNMILQVIEIDLYPRGGSRSRSVAA